MVRVIDFYRSRLSINVFYYLVFSACCKAKEVLYKIVHFAARIGYIHLYLKILRLNMIFILVSLGESSKLEDWKSLEAFIIPPLNCEETQFAIQSIVHVFVLYMKKCEDCISRTRRSPGDITCYTLLPHRQCIQTPLR